MFSQTEIIFLLKNFVDKMFLAFKKYDNFSSLMLFFYGLVGKVSYSLGILTVNSGSFCPSFKGVGQRHSGFSVFEQKAT